MNRTRLTSALVAGLLASAGLVLSAPAASAEEVDQPAVSVADETTEAPATDTPAGSEDEQPAAETTTDDEATAETAAAAAAPASISPAVTFSISPSGPWEGGQKVTVTTQGWAPGDSFTIFTCPKGVYPAANPPGAGCAAFTGPHGFFGVVDGSGKGSASITILQGSADGITCEKDGDCTIGVYGIDAEATPENTPAAKAITYVPAENPPTENPGTETPTTETPSTDTSGSGNNGPQLAETGSGQAAPYGLLALAAIGTGTVLLLAARRRGEVALDE